MGLALSVGRLADAVTQGDAETGRSLETSFAHLNDLLKVAGVPVHAEPQELPSNATFEAQMWGYSGLHTVRRLAAHLAIAGRLPPPLEETKDAAADPLLEQLYQQLLSRHSNRKRSLLVRALHPRRPKPKFGHLLLHSDAEGFYVPHDFPDVLLDNVTPQRDGLGGYVGSVPRLLDECGELARAIGLPDSLGVEADCLWENANSPILDGRPWEVYGVESFCLRRLIEGCKLSLASGAALAFV